MSNNAKVISIKSNTYYIAIEQNAKCGGCKACGISSTAKAKMPATSAIECEVGDIVEFEQPAKTIKFASLILYLLPSILMVAALFLTRSLSEILQISIAMIALVVSFGIMFAINNIILKKTVYKSKITKNLTKEQLL